jgi:competence protein ComEA
MRLGRASKQRAADEAELAVLRLAAMRKRSGWVPRVPEAVLEEVGDRTSTDTLVEGDEEEPGPEEVEDATSRQPAGRHRRAASRGAATDRLPLPVRALLESLPAGVRGGGASVERGQAIVIVLVILLGVVSTALLTGLGRPKVSTVEPSANMTVLATGTAVPGTSDEADQSGDHDHGHGDATELVVHVAGKVAEPGVVRLPPGSRVLDAVEAAGGADGDVDLTPLNLARPLVDGEQVAVGIDPPPAVDQPAGGPGAPAGPGVGLVNLNTATGEQLETLPGIGPALAAQILDWRARNGTFSAVEELQEVSGIGPKKFAGLADLVTV